MSVMDRAGTFIKDFENLVGQIGKPTYTRRVRTETKNTYGEVTAKSDADTTNLKGILREVSAEDQKLIDVGWAKIGQFKFHALATDGWTEHNFVVDGSDEYEILHVVDHGYPGTTATIHEMVLRKTA